MALKVPFLKDDNSQPKMFIVKESRYIYSVYLPLSNDMSFVTFYNTFDSSSGNFKNIKRCSLIIKTYVTPGAL